MKMSRINTNSWEEFKLIDIFDLTLSKGDNQPNKLNDGDIPLISSGSFNNGVSKYIDNGDGISEIFEGNSLTIDMFGQPFYQEQNFFAVSHGRINILKPKFINNKYISLFIVSVFRKKFFYKYGFNSMCSQSKLKNESILLPVCDNKKPDWQYMEDYMRQIESKVINSVFNLKSIKNIENKKVDIINWGEFIVGDLFYVNKKGENQQVPTGASVNKKDLIEGITPRISVSGINNGVIGFFKDLPDNKNYRVYENFISVSFLGTVFYHENKSSLDMKVHCLKPINHTLNDYTGKFIVTSLLASLRDFSYSDQISSTLLPQLIIKLPINLKGEPDWQYMEDYMRNIENKVKKSIEFLEKIIYL